MPEHTAQPAAPPPVTNLDQPQWYLNRELTWLAFNRRVLHEAQDDRVPLLERVFFLAVHAGNLDEFFMKRIGGLKQQVGAGVRELSVDGLQPQEQIDACAQVVREQLRAQEALEAELRFLLATSGIRLVPYADLDLAEKALADRFFLDQVYPLLTPQGMDPAHPFPFISNLSVNLLVTVRYPDSEHPSLARIKAPVSDDLPRFLSFGDRGHRITLEDLIANNMEMLFPDMVVESCEVFRVTRNAITEPDQEPANDLLQLIESALRDRRFAEIVRVEVGANMDPVHRGMLAAELGVDEAGDVYRMDGLIGRRDLFEIARLDRPELHWPPHRPVDNPELAVSGTCIFRQIRDHGSVLVQHPYESFVTSVERFLREASSDPKVRAIKMTLYRTAGGSRVIESLIAAARNGKQVAVVLELQARFDEQNNIQWAACLEEAGVHVTYGVVGLKTHCKVIFVVRRDRDGLRRYAHIGTGNYHAGTARQYFDLGLFTCDADIGADLTELFNYLTTGYTPIRPYRKLLCSPLQLKTALLEKIAREIRGHRPDSPGLIQLKANGLEDRDIVAALYRASQAGVRVDLIIRDTCRQRPGLPGLSATIRVVSLVGRFLEHARVLYFRNQGEEEYFLGSADLMTRNLESRVEVCVPVESPPARKRLRQLLDLQLANRRNAWEMQADGSYRQRSGGSRKNAVCIHRRLIELAERRAAAGRRSPRANKGALARG